MKKIILSSALLLGMVVSLSACATPKDETVATVGSETITESTLYDELKAEYGEATLQTMMVSKALESKYGDKVTDANVTSAYDDIVTQYGGEDQLAQMLTYYGYGTTDSYKKVIRQNLLVEAMVKDKYEITDDVLKDAMSTMYNFSVIQVDDEKTANTIIDKLKAGEKFADLATANSTDTYTSSNGGSVGWYDTSSDTTYSEDFIKAISGLKGGEYTTTAISDDLGVFIVQMDVNPSVDTVNVADYKDEISEVIYDAKTADSEYVQDQIAKLLKDEGVKISDSDLKDTLSAFGIGADGSSETTDKETSTTGTEEKTSTTETATSTTDSE